MPELAFNRKDALVSSEGRLSFEELRGRVAAAASTMRANRPPSILVRDGKKDFAFIVEFLAALDAEIPIAVFSSELTAFERAERMRVLEANRNAVHPKTALILFTSGSSGEPKAVQLSRAGIDANTAAVVEALRFSKAESQFLFLPLSYSYGLLGQLLPALAAGVTTHLLGDLLEARAVFLASGASGMWSAVASQWSVLLRMLEAEAPFPGVTHVISAGSRLDPQLKERLKGAFPGALLINNYGQTEASPRILSMASDAPRFFDDVTGYPVKGIQTRIGGSGELEVNGPQVMLGYLGDLGASAARLKDGWLHTGDRAEIAPDGLVTIRGRNDDLVKIAGERVSPGEVESSIQRLGWGPEACVVPVSDDAYGMRLVLVLGGAMRDDLKSKKDIELLRLLRETLSAAKVPARIVRLEALPRGVNGKVDRQSLRKTLNPEGST